MADVAYTPRERPILFSAPMVVALMDGTKTQTRRIAKPVRHPDLGNVYAPGALVLEHEPQHVIDRCCPYGRPGDRLWVRETFYAWGRWETRFSEKKGRDQWHFVDMTMECGMAYRYAESAPERYKRRRGGVLPAWVKRPSIHMPRAASRILLEITGVRVERLRDITEADAEAEGIGFLRRIPDADETLTAKQLYACLWESINGLGSFDILNPWVWVMDFKKLESK